MNNAQERFANRDGEDSRTFDCWYHNDDVQWLVWRSFQKISTEKKHQMHAPYVFFDGAYDIESYLEYCKQALIDSGKTFFPFIFKPELGSAHYMCGIIRKNSDGSCTLFLFNPTGYKHDTLSPEEFAHKRLGLKEDNKIAGMNLVVSSHVVQNPEFEKEIEHGTGSILVSCGPISIAFMQYAMNHPDWVKDLDSSFSLPEELQELTELDKNTYRERILELRLAHFELLGQIKDEDYDNEIGMDFFASFTQKLLDSNLSIENSSDVDFGYGSFDYSVFSDNEYDEYIESYSVENSSRDVDDEDLNGEYSDCKNDTESSYYEPIKTNQPSSVNQSINLVTCMFGGLTGVGLAAAIIGGAALIAVAAGATGGAAVPVIVAALLAVGAKTMTITGGAMFGTGLLFFGAKNCLFNKESEHDIGDAPKQNY
ncbi:hypothetical protein [Legionella israelensis]|uniref:Uncharacterized protein n=1 Tax=Legionella israelensis TaxID=454 RepID=A0A0W0WI68_9GAMM|nr:hypothetical protein [Legionella israelensis]KTD32033.1 hypothetical protein Lisr_0506 [Legionella israelensis]QBS09076.1 hypothetical protein E4T55_03930 [Legionella israelensis]SCY08707.1 hypothetical protein SAMN02746069_01235 [Legionella israelensis DSM 19235]STX58795.1 Uncharacterised protein [Legionella israelensis]